jgi:hypothetical protein
VKAVEIYGLYDPDTDELRYVGKANNAKKRLRTHAYERGYRRPVNNWVKSLIDQGKCPVMRILEVVPHEQWEEAERRLIAKHRETCKLLNLADGGAMPSQTKEQRRKAAKASNEVQMQRHPAWKKLVRAKQDYARLHSRYAKELDNPISLSLAAKMRFMMRLWAADRPDLYGSWATL